MTPRTTAEGQERHQAFKCGLEIHIQLDTKRKLFCGCSTAMSEKEPAAVVIRKQHPVASELGEIDVAAQYEFLRDRVFHYQVFRTETCLVDLDEEPPHSVNPEALEIALQIAMLLNCDIPAEVYVMRKTVIDGSNTAGFQRTMVVGTSGYISFKDSKVPISYVTLEEDAAGIVKEEDGLVTYRLNRLGVPLVEIGTGILEGFSPEDVQEIAYTIGIIGKSTGKVRRGIGTIRQDINISVRPEGRVELKGVQDLGMLSKVIRTEVERQLTLDDVKHETRAVRLDGGSEFLRPLPGSARMYPETDLLPIFLEKDYVNRIRRELPEPWTRKLERFARELQLSDQLAKQILRSDYLGLFERIVSSMGVEPSVVASTFLSTLKDLEKRFGVKIENLTDEHFEEMFKLLAEKKIVKEAIPEILRAAAEEPKERIEEVVKRSSLGLLAEPELREIISRVLEKERASIEKTVGLVMSQVRGRADSQTVIALVKEMSKAVS